MITYSEKTPTRIKLEKLKDGTQHFLILIYCVYFGSQYSSLKRITREIACVCMQKKIGRAPMAGKSQRPKKELWKVVQGDLYFQAYWIVK